MSRYCPYTDKNIVYTECGECEYHICEDDVFFCLVVGSRTFNDYDLLCQKLDKYLSKYKKVVIVTGGARGADALGEKYGNEKGYPVIVMPAEWDKYGKYAGYKRNEDMHRFISKQKNRGCAVFWDCKSAGTAHSFQLAEKYKNQLKVVRFHTDN